jgi:DUF1365 family protein
MTAIEHIAGTTFHARHGAVANAFEYGVDYLCLDPEASPPTPWFFSRNRRNLAALWDADHGGAPGQGRGPAWVREVLAAHGLDVTGRILLLAQPRILGHVFNPVSFWLVHDTDAVLRVVIAEVTNTFGERHSYLCHHPDLAPITRKDRLSATKIFYVSPFQPVEGGYRFKFDISADAVNIVIDYRAGSHGVYATLKGARRPLTARGLLQASLRRPFGSRRVLGLIHWQALKLWWKGARYRTRPLPPAEEVSR